jgi:short-subunit dehydrogenase
VITGGSRGLGLALAEQFLKEGANVTILARDQEELDRAQAVLAEKSVRDVLTVCCDVTDPEDLKKAFEQVEERFERIDILVNNAGTIAVGPFESMEPADYEAMMKLQLHAVVHAIQLAIPSFVEHGGGRIVNICSVGGKIPVPHMSSYCAGKFALAGFSESLGIELAHHNIAVTTVYPGMMQTGSPIQAVFKGDQEKEYAWFQTGDLLPLISVSAESAAKQIVDGVRYGNSQVEFPSAISIGTKLYALFPEMYNFAMRQTVRLLPQGQSKERKTGAESRQWLDNQRWYASLKDTQKTAETRLNQAEKSNAEFNLGIEASLETNNDLN